MSDLDLQLRRENVLQIVFPLIQSRTRLLDLGCGAGNLLHSLVDQTVELFGVDAVPDMIEQAQRRVPRATLLAADAAALPFAPESFDIVTCTGVLEYLPDPSAALGEIRRTTRPGGSLIVSFPNSRSAFRHLSRLEITVENGLIGALRLISGRGRPSAPRAEYRHQKWSFVGACSLLEDSGFQIRDARFNTYGLWGRLGRFSTALRFSRWMSARLARPSAVASLLASTMVIHATRT